MPFTPFHMGPGLLIKAILQGSFSLMVFGWAQIVMDIQPLINLLNNERDIHGFSHTYLGAGLLTILSAVTGKYLSEFGLIALRFASRANPVKISWSVTWVSAFIGTFSHVFLDSFMHVDMYPFYPLTNDNFFLHMISSGDIYKYCTYSGMLGAFLYYTILFYIDRKQSRIAQKID